MKAQTPITTAPASEVLQDFRPLLGEPLKHRTLSFIIAVNVFFLLCRPQNDFAVLAWIYLPLLFSLLPVPKTLGSLRTIWAGGAPPRSMIALLVLGFAWIIPARNNFWAAQTFRDLLQQDLCYFFPIMLFMGYGARLKRLVSVTIFSAIYLGIYSLTHGGRGPGGFLGDENDLCLQLDALLGIPLLLFLTRLPFRKKLGLVVAILIILAGIVATWSRGGFLGMLVVIGYMYWKTPRKIAAALMGIFVLLVGFAFVPQSYWDEMQTISNSQESTAKGRIDIWKIGLRVWLDPWHFLFGTGMQNSPYYLSDYEPVENQSRYGKSTGGRAVHSTYVQILGDLGLAGALIYLTAVLSTFRRNGKAIRDLRNEIRVTRRLGPLIDTAGGPSVQTILSEFEYTSTLLMGLNACMLGALGAGAFVSAAYYPTIWFLVAFGFAARRHSAGLLRALERLVAASRSRLERIEPRA